MSTNPISSDWGRHKILSAQFWGPGSGASYLDHCSISVTEYSQTSPTCILMSGVMPGIPLAQCVSHQKSSDMSGLIPAHPLSIVSIPLPSMSQNMYRFFCEFLLQYFGVCFLSFGNY